MHDLRKTIRGGSGLESSTLPCCTCVSCSCPCLEVADHVHGDRDPCDMDRSEADTSMRSRQTRQLLSLTIQHSTSDLSAYLPTCTRGTFASVAAQRSLALRSPSDKSKLLTSCQVHVSSDRLQCNIRCGLQDACKVSRICCLCDAARCAVH